jgi:hypothetical protein
MSQTNLRQAIDLHMSKWGWQHGLTPKYSVRFRGLADGLGCRYIHEPLISGGRNFGHIGWDTVDAFSSWLVTRRFLRWLLIDESGVFSLVLNRATARLKWNSNEGSHRAVLAAAAIVCVSCLPLSMIWSSLWHAVPIYDSPNAFNVPLTWPLGHPLGNPQSWYGVLDW